MSRRLVFLDAGQLAFDLEPSAAEVNAELLPGAVVRIINVLGEPGWQVYRLDWIDWEIADRWEYGPQVSLTNCDGNGGALIHGLDGLVAATWKGKDVQSIRKPEPHYRPERAYEQASRAGR